MGRVYLPMYPKKLGQFTPACSEIVFTMKFGPLPMYVFAPKKTAAIEIAFK